MSHTDVWLGEDPMTRKDWLREHAGHVLRHAEGPAITWCVTCRQAMLEEEEPDTEPLQILARGNGLLGVIVEPPVVTQYVGVSRGFPPIWSTEEGAG